MTSRANPVIGMIGIGAMGSRMARRLAARELPVVVFDTVPEATAALAAYPTVTVAAGLDDLAGCGAIITMLPDAEVVAAVLTGGPAPLAAALEPGTVVIDMSSSAPGTTVETAARLGAMGIDMIDAPVSGGVQGAANGTLMIMAGGDPDLVASWEWLFRIVGRACVHTGPIGSGHAVKALNNLLSAGGLLLAVEALAVGKQFGLTPSVMLGVINQSSGMNNSTQNKIAQRVLSRSFDAGFTIGLMTKDLLTAYALAGQVGVDAPLSAATVRLWSQALADLGPAADHTAIARWFESSSGVTLADG